MWPIKLFLAINSQFICCYLFVVEMEKFIPYSILVYMEKRLHTTCMQAFSQFFYINDERIKYITYKLM